VLTYVMLPGRDGLALIEQLRRRPATQRSPMIVLTARHGADVTAEGLAAGADDYITKPFSTEELLAGVHAKYELARLVETIDVHRGRISGSAPNRSSEVTLPALHPKDCRRIRQESTSWDNAAFR
jgi:DNA-binding response OmpR family regulator